MILQSKFIESFTPSESSAAVTVTPFQDNRKVDGIKLRETRLNNMLWKYKGIHQTCSHFPFSVFTNNVGRRSPEKLEERKRKQMHR